MVNLIGYSSRSQGHRISNIHDHTFHIFVTSPSLEMFGRKSEKSYHHFYLI